MSGCTIAVLDQAGLAQLKASLDNQVLPGRQYFDLYRMALQANDPVDQFLSLYRILTLLFPSPTGKESQKHVDKFILRSHPLTPQSAWPHEPHIIETVYSRLRNEIAHVRTNANLLATKSEMAIRRFELMDLVKLAINQQP